MWPSAGSQQGPAPRTSYDGARAPTPLPTPSPLGITGVRAANPLPHPHHKPGNHLRAIIVIN